MRHELDVRAGRGPEAPTLRRAQGRDYLAFLADMHRALAPSWYLEIGTQTGASLGFVTARSVAVDPTFALKHDVVSGKPEVHLVQDTSDAFFESGFLDRLGARFDIAFLDGMHLYEYLLRDFINAERHMAPGGRIVMHDCLPWEPRMAARDRQTRAWTGDVWKIVPILKAYRPDLDVTIYDAAPTGLVVVENLDPANTALASRYDEIVERFDEVDDIEGIVGAFPVTPTARSPWRAALAGQLNFAIQLPVPRPRVQANWGDYHFGVGLAEALRRKGHAARVQTRRDWGRVQDDDEIDIVLRGRAEYTPRPGHTTLYWVLSGGTKVPETELEQADHIFVAGEPLRRDFAARFGEAKVSLLPQAFDPGRMIPPSADAPREGIVFVGIARRRLRPMVSHALDTGTDIELWGSGWDEGPAAGFVRGDRVANEDLGALYGRAEIVLNDHTPAMLDSGLTSNRIFDALACGAPVITDPVAWMPEDIEGYVSVVETPGDFAKAVAALRSEGENRRAERRRFAEAMRATHSFDARAEAIVARARSLAQTGEVG